MILAILGCDTPATLYPVDPCRLGESFSAATVEFSCGGVSASAGWGDDTRAGGTRGEGWDGLSFYATGSTTSGGTLSLGRRPDGIGLYLLEGDTDIKVGFLPASTEAPLAPWVSAAGGGATCDAATGAGSVRLAGLPDSWTEDGTWEMSWDHGSYEADPVPPTWSAPWPATCPIHPAAWANVAITARCDGVEVATLDVLAPASYGVELDTLGQVATVSATWASSFSATCGGEDVASVDGSLQAEEGEIRFYSPILTVTRTAGTWDVEETTCGTCDSWEITVEGLPDL